MHRAALAALPRAHKVETLEPRTPGARHVVLDGDDLVFVARGHVWRERIDSGGSAALVASGAVDGVWASLACAHGAVLGLRIDARAVPPRPHALTIMGGVTVAAHAFGMAARAAVAVALDVESGVVSVIDLKQRTARTLLQLDTHQASDVPGTLSVSDDGALAYLTSAGSERGAPSLIEIDIDTARAHEVRRGPQHGHISGARWGRRVAVIEQELGDAASAPQLRVVKDGAVLLARAGFHPACAPVALSPEHLLFLMVTDPDPVTKSGDAQLCVLSASGSWSALAPVVGARIRVDASHVIVEDGRAVTRVTVAA